MGRESLIQPLIITQVERQKRQKHRYNIYINEEYAFSIHEDVMIKYRLLKGEAIDPKAMEVIAQEDERHKAYLTAIRYLSVRPRSAQEIRKRLKQDGHEQDLIEFIVERLSNEKYIDDAQFAKLVTEQRIQLNRKGRLWVKQELKDKGVAPSVIQETIGQIDVEEEEEMALQLAEKRWKMTSGDLLAKKRKLMGFLLRRGYTISTVQKVMNRMNIQDDSENDIEPYIE